MLFLEILNIACHGFLTMRLPTLILWKHEIYSVMVVAEEWMVSS